MKIRLDSTTIARTIAVSVIAIWCMLTLARNVNVLQQDDRRYVLNADSKAIKDLEQRYSIDDIVTPELQQAFDESPVRVNNFGLKNENVWVRVALPGGESDPAYSGKRDWYLEVAKTNLDVAELYVVPSVGKPIMLKEDMEVPYSKRQVKVVTSVFPLVMDLADPPQLFLHMKNKSSFWVPIILWSPKTFTHNQVVSELIFGVFYGAMLVMILYNFFIFVSAQDVSYLYYIGYLLSVTALEFVELGHGDALFYSMGWELPKSVIPITFWSGMIFATMFAKIFLDLKTAFPLIAIFASNAVAVFIVNLVLTLHYDDFASAISSAVGFAFVMFPALPAVALFAWMDGNKNGAFFLFAWIFNLSGFMAYALVAVGYLDATPLTLAAMPVGTLLEALLFSFALAERIKRTQSMAIDSNRRALANMIRYRSLFNNAIEGIYQMSLSGHITNANSAMARLFRQDSVETLINRSALVRNLAFPDGRFDKLLADGSCVEELDIRRDGRTSLVALHRAAVIFDRFGTPSHIEGTLIDITDSRQREEAVKLLQFERVEREFAEQATREQSDFLRKMSFQIRTPLAGILGFSEQLKVLAEAGRLNPAEKASLIHVSLYNSRTLLALINDILDYSKIEAGKMPLEQLPVDVWTLLANVDARWRSVAGMTNKIIGAKILFPLPKELITDPTRMRQVLQGVGSYFMDIAVSNEVSATLRWDHKTDSLQCVFRDRQLHLSEVEQQGMLLVFSDQGRSLPSNASGSTLRMVIAARLASMMSGSITVESEPDSGTTIIVLFRFGANPPQQWLYEAPKIQAVQKVPSVNSVPKLKGRILLAEDNVVNQKLVQRIISRTGADVVTVSDGLQAVEAVSGGGFDLVLMDVNMPVMDGLEATRRLRSDGFTRPVYALTAEYGQAEMDACISAGCDGHLTKPVQVELFYAVLAEHLQMVP